MLSNTLVTNEVKNAAGTEVEFQRYGTGTRSTEFAATSETPAAPNRLTIQHSESGSGINRRRRSVVRFDKTAVGQVDTTENMRASFYIVGDLPVGQLTSNALPSDVLAQLMSFVASLGASTTILYDGTGNGATVLLAGSI